MTSEILFAGLGLAEPLLRAVLDAGYTNPTPIQAQAIPLVLAGGDLLAAAQTGTGKTAGFTLPVLHRLLERPAESQKGGRPRCLILTPTRELAAQVEESVKTYGKHVPITSMVMFGGVAINPQMQALRKRVDILVATPGRLLDHVGQRSLDLSGVEILVLDEADRMLDMGFIRDIKKILALLPKKRQNLLFSATFSDEIRALADGLLNKPGLVEVARRNATIELTTQTVTLVPQKQKKELLAYLIKQKDWFQVLVFTRTKHGANKLAEYLNKQGIKSSAIHGNKSQGARTRALSDFKAGLQQVLVATDIAARGLDIDQLPQVVNFELPNIPEDYVHRIGRTGRAGSTGGALSLVDREEIPFLNAIERLTKQQIERIVVEGFIPSAPSANDDHADDRRPPRQNHGRGNGQPRGQGKQRQGQNARGANGQVRRSTGSTNNKSAQPRTIQASQQQAERQRNAEPDGNRAAPRPGNGNRSKPAPNASPARTHAPRKSQGQPRAALFSSKPANGNR